MKSSQYQLISFKTKSSLLSAMALERLMRLMISDQVRDSGKSIFEVLEWYNDIINFFIDYISLSIHDSDISEFYRYIIGFKNLLRLAQSHL